jgi:carbon-monoxide dehydrogenase iron sulfur subunit
MACPFGALTKDDERKIVFKCDLCPDRDVPACVAACPTKALFVGTAAEFERHLNDSKKGKDPRRELRHTRK